MVDPVSPDPSDGNLAQRLKQGVDTDRYDIHGSDSTTVGLQWTREFRRNMRRLASRNDFWSQTECEIIFMRESIKNSNSIMRDSGLEWLHVMQEIISSIEIRTNYRRRIENDFLIAKGSIARLEVGMSRQEEYRPKVLKEDSNKLSTQRGDIGIDKMEMVVIGSSRTILDNRELFGGSLADEAKHVLDSISGQVRDKRDKAEHHLREICSKMDSVIVEGAVYENDLCDALRLAEENYEDAYEIIKDEIDITRI